MEQILMAISHLHAQDIVHRDIKPQNIMVDSKERVRLIDFGFSDLRKSLKKTAHVAGTPYYMSPETIDFTQGKPSDMWSLGVLFYLMVSGHFPFKGISRDDLFCQIKSKPLKFDYRAFNRISSDCKDLLKQLLIKDPSKRITVNQALNHPFFKPKPCSNSQSVDLDTINRLRNFKGRTQVKKSAMKLLVRMRSNSNQEMAYLREQFDKIDKDNTGLIDLKKLAGVVKAHFGKREAKRIIRELDATGNQMISYSEFAAATM